MLDNVQVCELQNRRQVEIDLMVDRPKIVMECHKRNDPNIIIVIFANLPLKNCMRQCAARPSMCSEKHGSSWDTLITVLTHHTSELTSSNISNKCADTAGSYATKTTLL